MMVHLDQQEVCVNHIIILWLNREELTSLDHMWYVLNVIISTMCINYLELLSNGVNLFSWVFTYNFRKFFLQIMMVLEYLTGVLRLATLGEPSSGVSNRLHSLTTKHTTRYRKLTTSKAICFAVNAINTGYVFIVTLMFVIIYLSRTQSLYMYLLI